MKRGFSVAVCAAVVGSMMVASMTAGALPASAADITMTDAGLRACVNSALGQAPGAEITEMQAASITRLRCSNFDIASLEGIDRLTAVTFLRLENSPRLSDLDPVGSLVTLETLEIYQAPVSDIRAIGALENLLNLEILYTHLADLTPLAALPQLMLLNAYENRIEDVSPLAGITSLQGLTLADNLITDVSALSGLTNLNYLTLARNAVSDVSPLAGLTRMTYLEIDGNHIADISPLEGMTLLRNGSLRSQTISLPAIAVGTAQPNVVVGPDGSSILPTSSTAQVDAIGNRWSYAAAGPNTLSWSQDVHLGALTASFTGTILQESVGAPAVTGVSGTVRRDLDFSTSRSTFDGTWPSGTVHLLAGDVIVASAPVDTAGAFAFADIAPGSYRVVLAPTDADGWTQVEGDPIELASGARITGADLLYRENVPDPVLVDETRHLAPGEAVVIVEAPGDRLTAPTAPGSIFDPDGVSLGSVAPRFGTVELVDPKTGSTHSQPRYVAAEEWPSAAADADVYRDEFTYRYTNVYGVEAEALVTITVVRSAPIDGPTPAAPHPDAESLVRTGAGSPGGVLGLIAASLLLGGGLLLRRRRGAGSRS